MKPFNLADALAGKPVCTRDGREVKILFVSDKDEEYSVDGVVVLDESWEIECWDKDGKFLGDKDSDTDLFMKPEKKKLYISILKSPDNIYQHAASDAYMSRDMAESFFDPDTFQIVEVEIEV